MKKHNRPSPVEIDRRIALASMNEKVLQDITKDAADLKVKIDALVKQFNTLKGEMQS